MSYLDEDELDPALGGPGSRRPPSERQRQVFIRRVIALGVGVLILILLLLGVRGCLNARKERGFENYVSDLGGIVTQSNQLSQTFFGRLEDPPKGSASSSSRLRSRRTAGRPRACCSGPRGSTCPTS